MRKIVPILGAAALLLAAGCATRTEKKDTLSFPPPAITLTIQDAGKTVSLRPGEYAQISLKENASTGYSWFFRLDNGRGTPQPKEAEAVELAGERFLPPSKMIPGAPGVHELMVRAVRPGTTYVAGRCIRPWEKRPEPVQTINYRFEVSR